MLLQFNSLLLKSNKIITCSYYEYLFFFSTKNFYKNLINKNIYQTVYKKPLLFFTNFKHSTISVRINISFLYNSSDITLVITSCNRLNILKQSLNSFVKFNTYPISRIVIIEDSTLISLYILKTLVIEKKISSYYLKIINNKINLGQTRSTDKSYFSLKTKYLFHSEDDWRYYRFLFIEKSKNLFEMYEKNIFEKKLLQIWLRNYNEMIEMASFHWYSKYFKNNNLKYSKIFSCLHFFPLRRGKYIKKLHFTAYIY